MADQLYENGVLKIEKMAQYDLEEIFGEEYSSRASAEEIEHAVIIQVAEGAKCFTFEVFHGPGYPLDFIPWGGEGYELDLPPPIKKPSVKKSSPEIPTRPFPDVITPEIERNRDLILDAVRTTDDENALELDAVQMIDEAVALEIAKIMDTAYASELLTVRVGGTTFGSFFISADELEKDYRIILTSQGDIEEIWTCKNDILVPLFLTNPDEQEWDE